MKNSLCLFIALVLLTIAPLAVAADTPAAVSAPVETAGAVYVVQPGDWLSKIAASLLGDPLRFTEIVTATNERAQTAGDVDAIADPNRIEVGQRLWAPGDSVALWTQLQKATFDSEWVEGPVSLVNGAASVAAVPGSASKVEIRLISAAYADLDGDGHSDVAAVVATDPGGSGTFYTLEAFLSQGDALVHTATHLLGDRIRLQSLSAGGGIVSVNMLTAGPDDPLCCPSAPATKTLRLESGAWTEAVADWAYKGAAPSAGCCGRDVSLYLDVDGQAHLKTDFMNGEPPVVVDGAWEYAGDAVKVVLTTQDGKPLAEPQTHSLAIKGNALLSQDGALPTLTAFASMAWDRLDPPYDATAMASRFKAGEYTGAYKAYLPAASCCGQDITLYLNQDGTAREVTDYMNGDEPIADVGTWQKDAQGVTVTFTSMEGGQAFADPVVMRLLPQDGVLVSQETVPEAWGYRFYAFEGLAAAR
ncbi:MAG: copper resistance protein NlpE N-terminal domain-containing protein [Anaerolineae bacterium]|jgi:hypothetical protein